jgi:large subunit ribosomal protein L9
VNVILLQDVEKLGSMGEELTVKDGFARNYLIPGELAIEATPGALKVLEAKRKKKEREEKKLAEEAAKLAERLKDASVTIEAEAGEEEKLFGSVTADMISESLAAEGLEIDKRKIDLEEPIKKLGVYNVAVKLHPEIKAQVRVWVIKKA